MKLTLLSIKDNVIGQFGPVQEFEKQEIEIRELKTQIN